MGLSKLSFLESKSPGFNFKIETNLITINDRRYYGHDLEWYKNRTGYPECIQYCKIKYIELELGGI